MSRNSRVRSGLLRQLENERIAQAPIPPCGDLATPTSVCGRRYRSHYLESRNLINGQWCAADSGRTLAVINPANDQRLAEVPDAGAHEANRAVTAAHEAFAGWSVLPARERGEIVDKLGRLMLDDTEQLAAIMTAQQGKPLSEARGEIAYAASFLSWAAAEAERVYGQIMPAASVDKRILVLRQPMGVAAIVTPWNFPAAMITRKLGPALASGCTVVIKPAEQTPLSALAIGELSLRAGIPAGVVNIVTGEAAPIVDAMLADVRVRRLSFTGSTEIGRKLMAKASENLQRLSLELGGHAPFFVFDDADIEKAAAAAVACNFRNAGQTRICANRFYVQRGVYSAFLDRFRSAVEALNVGVGTDPDVDIGPRINDDAMEKVDRHVADAMECGGTVLTGGARAHTAGAADRFYTPTIIEGMSPKMLLAREETFGPVAAVQRFETEDEAVQLANDSPYGLAAYFFTRDASRLIRVAEALECGVVGANDGAPSTAQAPFGGVKRSGFGREGGHFVMDEYTRIKYVSWGV